MNYSNGMFFLSSLNLSWKHTYRLNMLECFSWNISKTEKSDRIFYGKFSSFFRECVSVCVWHKQKHIIQKIMFYQNCSDISSLALSQTFVSDWSKTIFCVCSFLLLVLCFEHFIRIALWRILNEPIFSFYSTKKLENCSVKQKPINLICTVNDVGQLKINIEFIKSHLNWCHSS